MKSDLDSILEGPTNDDKKFYILSALSDLHELLKSALKSSSREKNGDFSKVFPDSQFPEVKLQSKSVIKLCIKKVEFYLSYTQHCLKI